MNSFLIIILCFFALFNLLGVGIYHYEWKHAIPYKTFKCSEFTIWTVTLFVFGTAYCLLRLIVFLVSKVRNKK